MKTRRAVPKSIDDYIGSCPQAVRGTLEKLRATIRRAAPQAEEKISYQMPAFYLNGNLVYFAAFKEHISFFPTSSATAKFRKELSKYDGSKGTVRFPLGTKIPFGLISKIVKLRVKENLEKAKR